jgi:hypothetical protein
MDLFYAHLAINIGLLLFTVNRVNDGTLGRVVADVLGCYGKRHVVGWYRSFEKSLD